MLVPLVRDGELIKARPNAALLIGHAVGTGARHPRASREATMQISRTRGTIFLVGRSTAVRDTMIRKDILFSTRC
jgi:hypothetical protein